MRPDGLTGLVLIASSIGIVSVAAVIAALALRSTITIVEVSGVSMLPTLRPGERVVARRTAPDRVRAGDIVVYRVSEPLSSLLPVERRYRHIWRIKRVAAVPGDPMPVERVAAVPGDPMPASTLPVGPRPDRSAARVPDRTLYVLGDNAARSADSRHTGPVSWEDVYGVVRWRLARRSVSQPERWTASRLPSTMAMPPARTGRAGDPAGESTVADG